MANVSDQLAKGRIRKDGTSIEDMVGRTPWYGSSKRLQGEPWNDIDVFSDGMEQRYRMQDKWTMPSEARKQHRRKLSRKMKVARWLAVIILGLALKFLLKTLSSESMLHKMFPSTHDPPS